MTQQNILLDAHAAYTNGNYDEWYQSLTDERRAELKRREERAAELFDFIFGGIFGAGSVGKVRYGRSDH